MAKSAKLRSSQKAEWEFPFHKGNYQILLIGIATILLGYLLMATGITETPAGEAATWNNFFSVYASPTILVIGYCVIVPLGIIKYFSSAKKDIANSND